MSNWEKNVRKVVPYVPGEQPHEADMIKLNTNENPYPPSPKAAEAIRRVAEEDTLRLYPDPTAAELVQAIADVYHVSTKQVFVGVGSDDVLAMAFMTYFNSDKPILFPDITYSFYDVWAEEFRIPYEQIPLDENFCIVPEQYFAENHPNGGIVFPNPNAPTGVELSLSAIESILQHMWISEQPLRSRCWKNMKTCWLCRQHQNPVRLPACASAMQSEMRR